LHEDAHRDAGVVAAAELLGEDRGVAPVETEPAELRIVADAEHPELSHLRVEGLVDVPHLVELARARDDFLLDELADGVTELPVLRRREQLVLGKDGFEHGADSYASAPGRAKRRRPRRAPQSGPRGVSRAPLICFFHVSQLASSRSFGRVSQATT